MNNECLINGYDDKNENEAESMIQSEAENTKV